MAPEPATRSFLPELMDAPDVDEGALRTALDQLALINILLGGHSTSLAGLRRLLPLGATHFSVLDVGCGSGDTLLAVGRWALANGMTARLSGIELSPISADLARRRIAGAGIRVLAEDESPDSGDLPPVTARITVHNLFQLPDSEQFDIVHAALVLHHLTSDAQVCEALAKMFSLSRRGVVVNDLHRHPLAHNSIRLLTRLFSRSPIIRHDAPLSVRRSFTRAELLQLAEQGGLPNPTVEWRWAFRWLLVSRKV